MILSSKKKRLSINLRIKKNTKLFTTKQTKQVYSKNSKTRPIYTPMTGSSLFFLYPLSSRGFFFFFFFFFLIFSSAAYVTQFQLFKRPSLSVASFRDLFGITFQIKLSYAEVNYLFIYLFIVLCCVVVFITNYILFLIV